MKFSPLFAFIGTLGLLSGAAVAAPVDIFFSTTAGPTSAAAVNPGNPTITLPMGGIATLYVWGRIGATGTTNRLSGLALDVTQSVSGRLNGSPLLLVNPANDTTGNNRWDAISGGSGGSGTTIESGSNAVTILNDGFAVLSDLDKDSGSTLTTASFYLGSMTVTGLTAGTADLFFAVGQSTISYKGTSGQETTINFGTGDAAITAATIGAKSTVADATITVLAAVREPASLGLLGLGGMALLARRRRIA
jgi:hypothetical protein